ncbi:MAG: ATP-binding protein [Kiritimatiellae bacterium]|nr:ATP-binding protein [Kiritimatiellia bacterium]
MGEYLSRKIDEALATWHRGSDKLPILLNGARQVGKTESIRHFAARNYENFIEVNFVKQPQFKNILLDGYSADAIVKRMSLLDPSLQFQPGKTLLFFDEIQDFPDMATSLKFFHEDGRFDVILSGSLLGIHYKRISSIAVGAKKDMTLRSFDFEEFLNARGYGPDFIERIYSHVAECRPFDKMEEGILHGLFMDFCILGGMPKVVSQFVSKGTFEGTLDTQRGILNDYRDDVRKYAEGLDQTRILNVFDNIPPQLAKENKKFQVSKVARNARFADYKGCVEWLKDAGVINLCHAMPFPALPIKGNYDPDKFKIYMADTGLLVAQLDDEAQQDLRANENLGVYKGGLYENIVADALAKQGYALVYFKKDDSTLEQDFFVRTARHLIPVEVKAATGCAQSMRTLIKGDKYEDISWGIKFHGGNIGMANGILTLPYYTAFLLKRFLSEHGEELFAE